jgi:hypothetical protein
MRRLDDGEASPRVRGNIQAFSTPSEGSGREKRLGGTLPLTAKSPI